MELYTRAIRNSAQPHIKILPLPGLKEQHSITIIKLRNLIKQMKLTLGVKLGVLLGVREKRDKVVEKVSMTEGDAAG